MQQKYTFGQIKEYLKGLSPLRFQNLSREDLKEKNPTDFVKNFFKYNSEYKTIYAGNGQTQTVTERRRSLGDIFRITYYYFPKVRLITIYRALLAAIGEGIALSAICQETGLRVYRATKGSESGIFNGEKIDEFYVDFNQFEEINACKPKNGWWGDHYGSNDLKFINVK